MTRPSSPNAALYKRWSRRIDAATSTPKAPREQRLPGKAGLDVAAHLTAEHQHRLHQHLPAVMHRGVFTGPRDPRRQVVADVQPIVERVECVEPTWATTPVPDPSTRTFLVLLPFTGHVLLRSAHRLCRNHQRSRPDGHLPCLSPGDSTEPMLARAPPRRSTWPTLRLAATAEIASIPASGRQSIGSKTKQSAIPPRQSSARS